MDSSDITMSKRNRRKHNVLRFTFCVSVTLCFVLGIYIERNTPIINMIYLMPERLNITIIEVLSQFEFFFQKCDYLMEHSVTIKRHYTYSQCSKLCPKEPPGLVGRVIPQLVSPTFDALESKFGMLKPGGLFSPVECTARHKVAIIIAYRNRQEHLRILLNNLHPFLQKQQLDYGIFVVEQDKGCKFNRAMLMNIGFKEVVQMYDFNCFVFHDVDHLPENDYNIYGCSGNPRHMAVAVDKFGYKLFYDSYFGGVFSLSMSQMEAINGFPNRYFGWGGEDDDIYTRLVITQYKVVRYAVDIARYRTVRHGRDRGNEDNDDRFRQLGRAAKLLQSDGLSTLKYSLLRKENKKLYTWIYVRINETEVLEQYKQRLI